METVSDSILCVLPDEEHDRLIRLLKDGPPVVEKLTGRRPDRSVLWRQSVRGIAGVTLKTVSVGRCLMTTPRWLVEFWVAVDAARRKKRGKQVRPRRGRR